MDHFETVFNPELARVRRSSGGAGAPSIGTLTEWRELSMQNALALIEALGRGQYEVAAEAAARCRHACQQVTTDRGTDSPPFPLRPRQFPYRQRDAA